MNNSDSSSPVVEQIKLLLEGSVDASVVLDEDRRIKYFNPAYQAASGLRGRSLARAAAQDKHCYDIFPLEICETACLGCSASDAGRALRVDEIKAVRGDGEELTLIVSAVPLPNGYIVETYRDVTADARIQRKYKVLLEHERQAKDRLEQTVKNRTEELRNANAEIRRTQSQLIHQEKMSSLGRLVAGIAHELNNPINFVYGNIDFLGRYMDDLISLVQLMDAATGEVDEESKRKIEARKEEVEYDFLVKDTKKLIRSIRAGAERTAGIVRDLKAFSRAGSGELDEADLAAGIDTTLNLIAPVLKHRITVVKNYDTDTPRVVCNAGHVNQVFMNILTNAAQSIEGDGTIEVSVASVDEGKSVQVSIRDTGAGIAPEVLDHIFDPFFTTKDVGQGTGLGLAISESIVRSHGGRLTCESTPGQGASFRVILPVRPPATSS